jgi:hypothetical protein
MYDKYKVLGANCWVQSAVTWVQSDISWVQSASLGCKVQTYLANFYLQIHGNFYLQACVYKHDQSTVCTYFNQSTVLLSLWTAVCGCATTTASELHDRFNICRSNRSRIHLSLPSSTIVHLNARNVRDD